MPDLNAAYSLLSPGAAFNSLEPVAICQDITETTTSSNCSFDVSINNGSYAPNGTHHRDSSYYVYIQEGSTALRGSRSSTTCSLWSCCSLLLPLLLAYHHYELVE